MIGLIALLLPLAMFLVMTLWGLVIGLKRTRVRFMCVAVSFVGALILALSLKKVDTGALINSLISKVGNNEFLTALLEEASLRDALFNCGGAIIAPWAFFGAFVLLCTGSAVVCGILFIVFRIGKKSDPEDDEVDFYESGYIDLFGGYGLYGEVSLFSDFGELVENVWPKVATGEVKPTMYKELPIQQAEEAHAILESGVHVGKVVLKV